MKQWLTIRTETCSSFPSWFPSSATFYCAVEGQKEIPVFCKLAKGGVRGVEERSGQATNAIQLQGMTQLPACVTLLGERKPLKAAAWGVMQEIGEEVKER